MPDIYVRAAAEGLPAISRRAALGALASISAIGATQAAPAASQPLSRPEQIKHHFYALKALLEEEFQSPWLIVTCSVESDRGLSITSAGLNDPYGIIGPVMRHGEVVS
ncbi:hypothetical protein EN836_13760 [Mesorhizobium sp. M1C.F.Ca.ET.193.01.1.1]|uniref:hypothetical protein n=1 Tax=unclassified Mesorhizobium TaxID=325217 RepID=UPI000FD2ECEF|nr:MULTISPECIES: hypothetical protein [unclassified Mesorhizobium]TGT00281.1 hypothetical protein EN820_32495 [bacterium M00.F.Ca.ET.177.01.1.1]TGQ53686.1 hypothetical protein EN853_13765 [Mesorhizobium sp. M1C.F.Ca.ET.210.01.1.1]TGQ71718.1 hypothetical protein EN855_013770 [Mesorhizobium sp. M1C.F.Ca.ET.212.01.1.1]TGR08460.1 hypothetical protein EN847_13765 [Mesorhizobium sp. M1C.F.Ca.ET.204.01.1.1]TGR28700.1 hypothetical protein EN839_13770 [Mesorhizobium sp. M1C.F.Ca.ET.196.01.1.1]